MSSLVLLDNREGVVCRKLGFTFPPDDFVIPEGKTLSWRSGVEISSRDPLAVFSQHLEPVEAYFYLGSARGQVCRGEVKQHERREDCLSPRARYCSRTLTITVQGTSAKDVMKLRDRIMQLIDSGAHWEVSNDLNPKSGFLRQLFGMLK